MAGSEDPEGDDEGEGVRPPLKPALAAAAAAAIMGSGGMITPDCCMCMALAAAMATIDCWNWAAAK